MTDGCCVPHDAPDPRVLEVRAWLARASEDLRAGRHDLTASPPLLNDAAFHAPHCAEKALNAVLVHTETPFRKTHNLTELGAGVVRVAPSLNEVARKASLLTEFAWRFRYLGDPVTINVADAERAIELAARTLDSILAALPSMCRSV